jgi:solute carrier family 6 (neurotransmitter transporter)
MILLQRIELLYRPAPWGGRPRSSTGDMFTSMATDATTGIGGNTDASDDPPPKYTPPPSYTTATGAR